MGTLSTEQGEEWHWPPFQHVIFSNLAPKPIVCVFVVAFHTCMYTVCVVCIHIHTVGVGTCCIFQEKLPFYTWSERKAERRQQATIPISRDDGMDSETIFSSSPGRWYLWMNSGRNGFYHGWRSWRVKLMSQKLKYAGPVWRHLCCGF